MDVLLSLLDHPLILSNKILTVLTLLIIYILFLVFVFEKLQHFVAKIIGVDNEQEINANIKQYITLYANKLKKSAKNRTNYIINFLNKTYYFSSEKKISIPIVKYFSFWSWKSFVIS